MKLRAKLLHLVRMHTNVTYRQQYERHARFARVMAVNKSIMQGK